MSRTPTHDASLEIPKIRSSWPRAGFYLPIALRLTSVLALRVSATALVTVLICHLLLQVIPGDPLVLWAGPRPTPAQLQHAQDTLRLDQPIARRVLGHLGDVVSGDLGTSWRSRRPVATELIARLPVTIELAVLAVLLLVTFAYLTAAAWIRVDRNRKWIFDACTVLPLAAPPFMFAILLQLLFSSVLPLMPLHGRLTDSYTLSYDPLTGSTILDATLMANPGMLLDALLHLALPAIALAASLFPLIVRSLHDAWENAHGEPWVDGLSGCGVPSSIVRFRLAVRVALAPPLYLIGLSTGYFITGAIVSEGVFGLPGIGQLALDALQSSDLPVILGTVLVFAISYATLGPLLEALHALLDPRVQSGTTP